MTTTTIDPIRLAIIVGSTREGRATDRFLPWLVQRAEDHGAYSVEVLDLRHWDLPMFQETMATIGAGYSTTSVRRWNERVAAADAYLFVTPEYNHSVPGVLKNAIDNVVASHGFRNKPAGSVGYSGGIVGGARAVEHLAGIAVEAELVPLRNAVLLAQVGKAFDADGRPVDPATDVALGILLDDLAWWGDALRQARRAGELPPANRRRATPPATRPERSRSEEENRPMAVQLNHTIVLARDKQASATFLAEILGLPAPKSIGPFMAVAVDNDITLDFMDVTEEIRGQHYAFLIGEADFDEVFGRVRQRELQIWADPFRQHPGEINTRDGGRGFYFEDPNGHFLEVLTRPYGSGG